MKRLFSIAVILILLAVLFSACSGGYGNSSDSAPAPQADASDWAGDYGDYDIGDYAAEAEGGGTPLPLLTPDNPDGTKMVYTVNMQLETTTFAEGTRFLLTEVGEIGGYVESTYVQGRSLRNENMPRSARYTLRIPSEHLAEFLMTMEDNYNLLQLEQESQNVTRRQSADNSHLEALMEQEALIREELELLEGETGDDEDLLEYRRELERELLDIQYDIGALTAVTESVENAVIYSTVTIHLYEILPESIGIVRQETFNTRLNETASNSWNGFLAFCQAVLLFVITVLPALVILGIVAAIGFGVYRTSAKKRMKRLQRQGEGPAVPGTAPAPPVQPEQDGQDEHKPQQ